MSRSIQVILPAAETADAAPQESGDMHSFGQELAQLQTAGQGTQQSSADDRRYNRLLTGAAAALVMIFILLGHWQCGRVFRAVDGYSVEPPAVTLAVLVPPGGRPTPAALSRQVNVTGTYDGTSQRLLSGKSIDGSPVSWVVTTLRTQDGRSVQVVRGWTTTSDLALIAPPIDPVTLTARLEVGSDIAPSGFYLVRTAQSPPDPLSLQPVPSAAPQVALPRLFHLQNAIYVVQWYLLVIVVVVAWWRLRRRSPDALS